MGSSDQATPSHTGQNSNTGGTLYLIVIQFVSRGLTFVGNQILLRYLSPTHLGLSIQLETLSVSVLYTARESLRVALQRQPTKAGNLSNAAWRKTTSQTAVNLAYPVLLGGVLLALLFGSWYLYQIPSEVVDSANFSLAFRGYALATLIELAAEPCFVVIQQHQDFRARARAETLSAITRCVSACTTAIIMSRRGIPYSVLPFAIGQLCYAAALSIAYFGAARQTSNLEQFSLLPQIIQTESTSDYLWTLFYKPVMTLAGAFYGQSIFKWLLTQGDTLVLSLFADLQAQGIFALASNYGGLISRLLFQPVEESSRNIFGRLLSSAPEQMRSTRTSSLTTSQVSTNGVFSPGQNPPTSKQSSDTKATSNSKSNTNLASRLATNQVSRSPVDAFDYSKPTLLDAADSSTDHDAASSLLAAETRNVDKALAHLTTVLHAYFLLIVLPCITLLPHLFPLLIRLLLGGNPTSHWNTAETFDLLAVYSYYIPCLAINGILDAFVTSVATEAQLGLQSVLMVVITILYLGSAWVAMQRFNMGAVGLVNANMLGMTLRIGYSVWFIRDWVAINTKDGRKRASKMLRQSIPHWACLSCAVVVGALLNNVSGIADSSIPVSRVSPGMAVRDLLSGLLKLEVVQGFRSSIPLGRIEQQVTSWTQSELFLRLGDIIVAGIFLGISIIVFERQFLVTLLNPFLPLKVKAYIEPYLQSHGVSVREKTEVKKTQ